MQRSDLADLAKRNVTASQDLSRISENDDESAGRTGRVTLSTLTHSSMNSLDTRSGRNQLQLLNVADLQPSRLQAHIQNVFENTSSLEDSAFLYFISSLCRLSADMLAAAPSIPRSAAADSGPTSPRGSGFKGSSLSGRAKTCPHSIRSLALTSSHH